MVSVSSVERKLLISESNEVYFSCRTKAISTKLFLHSKRANRIIKEEKYLRNLCYLWEINNNFPCHPCIPCEIKVISNSRYIRTYYKYTVTIISPTLKTKFAHIKKKSYLCKKLYTNN